MDIQQLSTSEQAFKRQKKKDIFLAGESNLKDVSVSVNRYIMILLTPSWSVRATDVNHLIPQLESGQNLCKEIPTTPAGN